MSNFLSQTTFCPTCGGTGYTDIEDNRARAKCIDCQGNGVFVRTTDSLLFFNSSSYVDFLKRGKIKKLKLIYFVIFGALILALLAGVFFLYQTGSKYLDTNSFSPF